ncbi:tetratricopeptide repeat protein [Croceimicrobium hydrocarbonivorans]|uniref:Tetratricopeptide repeat protein n=1 Tax=Croceimicrobium hydrocarbonivorans TaxID=2761580 RepID=A0A7H0VG62_9FLAO|nr:tetratricopeptide repeat protein [Croceimicrobium hydrocarbonivorans]QNR24710.1 tetratricopeptide repeat protein [Croceimicrobium hydrocarbonivorans]
MRQSTLILLLIIGGFHSGLSAQGTVLKKSQALIYQNLYAQAFAVLDQADSKNQNSDIFVAKLHLILDFHCYTKDYLHFALCDLHSGEKMDSLRSIPKEDGLIYFKADSIGKELLIKEPGNMQLHLAMGYFYQKLLEANQKDYMPSSAAQSRMQMHYELADRQGSRNYQSMYSLGILAMKGLDFQSALPYLQKAIELKPDHAESQANLAYALLQLNRQEEARLHADLAQKYFEDPILKAEAASMMALSFLQSGKDSLALNYFRQAYATNPDEMLSLRNILQLERKLDSNSFKQSRFIYFKKEPKSTTTFKDLYSLHPSLKEKKALLAFYQEQLKTEQEPVVLANLHLFSAVLLKDFEEADAMQKELALAREIYLEEYPPEHDIFVFMRSYFSPKNSQ